MQIALALGGGGAKGNAHIGVLRRLDREGYKICSIAGTSFGGIVGILYALGNSPAEIQEMFEAVNQNKLYGRDPQDGPALLGLSGARRWLDKIVGDKTFADLKIPCAVTAVNVKTGVEVTIMEGGLKSAILATIALPGIFPPHHINGWELIDGGVLNPVPVSISRMLSPDLPVVAVILNDPMDKPMLPHLLPMPNGLPHQIVERITRLNFAQAYDIFMRAVDISSRAVAHFRLELDAPDVIVRPAVHHLNLLDKIVVAEVAQLGEDALEKVLPQLKYAVSWKWRLEKKIFGIKR